MAYDTRAIRLRWRSRIAIVFASAFGLMAFLWPLFVSPTSSFAWRNDAPLIFAALLPIVLIVVLSEIYDGTIDVKAIAMLGVLAAIGAALRPMGAGTAGIETVFVLLILGGRVFGAGFGFVLGATTLFVSALLTGGVGPWLPFQMIAASWVGLGAGLLPQTKGKREMLLLACYAAFAAILFGMGMNLAFWPFAAGIDTQLSFVPGDSLSANMHRFVLFSITTSLGWDIGRAITNVALVMFLGPIMLGVFRRAARRVVWSKQDDLEWS